VSGLAFSAIEDDLHSKASTVTGFSFIVFAVAATFIESTGWRKLVALGVASLGTILSILIFTVVDLAGVWQRAIFITAFAWLMYFLYSRNSPVPEATVQ
jgi:hypothetical protein